MCKMFTSTLNVNVRFGNAKSCCLFRTPGQGTYILLWCTLVYHLFGLGYAFGFLDFDIILGSIVFCTVIVLVCVPGILFMTSSIRKPELLLPFVLYRLLIIFVDLFMVYSSRQAVLTAALFACTLLVDLHFADVVFTAYKTVKRVNRPFEYSNIL